MKNMFAQLEQELTSSMKGESSKASGSPPTRWERAVVGLDKIVVQVVKVDPDGVDVVCFGGSGEPEWYRNLKDTKGLQTMVAAKRPAGECAMGAALESVFADAFEKDLEARPVSVLVLTAGRPDDADTLVNTLMATVERCAENYKTEECPISVTFVQIGNDQGAEMFLKKLDGSIQKNSIDGQFFDLVDTIKDEEIQKAMTEIKGTQSSGKSGALVGALAGAALGVGGMYIYNKQQAKKRTEGWGGNWKVSYNGQEITTLTITDDQAGNLTIEGFPSGEPTTGSYSVDDEDEEYVITFKDPSGDWDVEGTVEDEHAITWSDGTRWDELPPDGGDWKTYAAAGAAGAAAAGATGYLLDKKFFNKASKADQCDYYIVMDRSAAMAVVDDE